MFKHFVLLIILSFPIFLWAQPTTNSPYSRFGIGDIADRSFVNSLTMGGLSNSFIDPYQINIVNPASLSFLSATSFDIGFYAEHSSLRNGATENQPASEYQGLWNGNLSYLSLAIPLQNKLNDVLDRKYRPFALTTAFSLLPYSTVGYNIKIDEFDENIGEIKKRFEGSGGSYQFLWSNGVRYKKFAFGVNLGYLFGKIKNARLVEFEDNSPFYRTRVDENHRLSGFLWDFGVMYDLHFKSKKEDINENDRNHLSLGFRVNSGHSFNVDSDIFSGSQLGTSTIIDTLNSSLGVESKGKLPPSVGFGATYYNGQRFALGVNYSTTSWSNFEADFVNNTLNDTYKLSFGGYYRPDYKSIGSYFERVYYRFGFFYNQIPNEIPENNNETIKDVGISFGVGMPFFYQRKISHANLGFTLGWLGQGTAVEEKYFKISFSFTFNDDEWFIKRKYN